jgi:hypothetical protein
MNQVLRAARKLLSDNVLAQFEYLGQIEYHLRPNLGEVWGGPFNGQWNRQRIVTDLIRTFQPSAIVETGTFRGASTLFFALNSQVPIYSTEANRRFYGFAARRLRHWPKVTLIRQDSRAFLKTLDLPKDRPVFFYLDAHWEGDLPLHEEIEIILGRFPNFLIMIDDFRVPGDSGYGFDDYGPGKMLALRDFPFHEDRRMSVYFPTCQSEADTGTKRGCVVLVAPSSAMLITETGALQRYDCEGRVAHASVPSRNQHDF